MTTTQAYADQDGDFAEITFYDDGEVILQADRADAGPADPIATVLLERQQVLDLYHRLGDHLVRTAPVQPTCPPDDCCNLPDATADGYDWTAQPRPFLGTVEPIELPATVLEDAQAAVYGDREADYGHPREDFTRQAILYTGLLQHKLAEGEYVEAEDIARLMIATKLARDVHSPKRDNRVDGAGYFLTLDRLATGQ